MLFGCSIASPAFAVPLGAFWIEHEVIDSPLDSTNLSGFRTFDLYVLCEPGDVIFAADSGVSSPSTGLRTTQDIFNHPLGAETQTAPPNILFDDVVYDTHLAMGDLDGTAGDISVLLFDTSNPELEITAEWAPNGSAGITAANPDLGDSFWMGRFTVSSAGGFGDQTGLVESLGGQLFIRGEGPGGEPGTTEPFSGLVFVPDAFGPTPGAVTVFGLAGIAACRRKR